MSKILRFPQWYAGLWREYVAKPMFWVITAVFFGLAYQAPLEVRALSWFLFFGVVVPLAVGTMREYLLDRREQDQKFWANIFGWKK